MSEHNVYRDGKVHVMAEKCSTCIFRGGNLMHLESGRVKGMVEEAVAAESVIVCHQTLDAYGDNRDNAACRGYTDAYGDRVSTLRLAQALGIIEEVGVA